MIKVYNKWCLFGYIHNMIKVLLRVVLGSRARISYLATRTDVFVVRTIPV